MADPLRMRILDLLRGSSLTTKQVAIRLGEPPTKLYHHVQLLEKAGLIRLQSTKNKRGTVEKYFRAVAGEFIVDRGLMESKAGPKSTRGYESLMLSAVQATLADIQASIAARLIRPIREGRNALAFRCQLRGSEQQMKQRMEKVLGWIQECQGMRSRSGSASYGITIAFYPVAAKRRSR